MFSLCYWLSFHTCVYCTVYMVYDDRSQPLLHFSNDCGLSSETSIFQFPKLRRCSVPNKMCMKISHNLPEISRRKLEICWAGFVDSLHCYDFRVCVICTVKTNSVVVGINCWYWVVEFVICYPAVDGCVEVKSFHLGLVLCHSNIFIDYKPTPISDLFCS